MATPNSLNTRLVMRNDSAAAWESANPKLLAGEIGIENDTGLFKIGDGSTLWNALEYANKFDKAAHYEGTAAGAETDEAVIARVMGEKAPAADDVFVVKRAISGEKYSFTAYVYNGSAWAAMDGNYGANNVYLNEDVVVTTATGELKKDSTITAGTSLQDMLVSMLSQEKDPGTPTQPSVSAFSVKDNNATDFEAGSTVTPKWDSTFSKGSYSYKSTAAKDPISPVDGTGVTVTSWTITQDGTTIGTTEDGTGAAFIMGDSTINFKAVAVHTAGNYALTNLNKLPETDVQIAAGSKEKTATMTSYRKMFAGGVVDKDAAITSAVIRGLGTGVKATTSATEFKALVGDTKLIFAYPKSLTTKTPKFEYFTMSWEGFSGFEVAASTVQVADKRGGENGLKEYVVYTYTPTGAFESETKFRVSF